MQSHGKLRDADLLASLSSLEQLGLRFNQSNGVADVIAHMFRNARMRPDGSADPIETFARFMPQSGRDAGPRLASPQPNHRPSKGRDLFHSAFKEPPREGVKRGFESPSEPVIAADSYVELAKDIDAALDFMASAIKAGQPEIAILHYAEKLGEHIDNAIMLFPNAAHALKRSMNVLNHMKTSVTMKLGAGEVRAPARAAAAPSRFASLHGEADRTVGTADHPRPSANDSLWPNTPEHASEDAGTRSALAARTARSASSGRPEAPDPKSREASRGLGALLLQILGQLPSPNRRTLVLAGALGMIVFSIQMVGQVTSGFKAFADDQYKSSLALLSKKTALRSQSASSALPGDETLATGSISAPAPSQQSINTIPSIPASLALSPLTSAVGTGDATAMFELATKLRDGRGVERDPASALKWLKSASDLGHIPSMLAYAQMLEKGAGVAHDLPKAMAVYRKASDLGSPEASHLLGAIYANGPDGAADYKQAFALFERAAKAGHIDSQYNLGVLYATGQGTRQNLQESYKWLELASRNGDRNAMTARDDMAKRLDARSLSEAKAQLRKLKADGTSG